MNTSCAVDGADTCVIRPGAARHTRCFQDQGSYSEEHSGCLKKRGLSGEIQAGIDSAQRYALQCCLGLDITVYTSIMMMVVNAHDCSSKWGPSKFP